METRVVAALRKDTAPTATCPAALCTTDPIDVSNACRAFYQSRLQAARSWKEQWGASTGSHPDNGNGRKKSSIDKAMDKLRKEMASLMEQDLTLMKQLLTLNEEIEELKWRRRYCWSRYSVMTSSFDVDLGSATDFTASESSLGWKTESSELPSKYPGPSSLSLHRELGRLSVYDEEDPMGTFNRRSNRKGSTRTLTPADRELEESADTNCTVQESFDSGIHEGFFGTHEGFLGTHEGLLGTHEGSIGTSVEKSGLQNGFTGAPERTCGLHKGFSCDHEGLSYVRLTTKTEMTHF